MVLYFQELSVHIKKQHCSPNFSPKTKEKRFFTFLLPYPNPKRTRCTVLIRFRNLLGKSKGLPSLLLSGEQYLMKAVCGFRWQLPTAALRAAMHNLVFLLSGFKVTGYRVGFKRVQALPLDHQKVVCPSLPQFSKTGVQSCEKLRHLFPTLV